jgi:heptaprenyl diphosphate synthase
VLVACASVLQVAESLLPHPLPGVRLGLANMITLIALVYMGPGSAVQLAVLRTVVSSMVMGTFLTPTFVLSFSGGVLSALVMVLLYTVSRRGGPLRFSIIGISVAGSASHIGTQVALVYLLFVRSGGVLWLWPWLALGAVATGVVTGLIAVQAFRRLEDYHATGHGLTAVAPADPPGRFDSGSSFLYRLGPIWKIVAVVVIGLAVVLFSNYLLYLVALLLLLTVAAVARVSTAALARSLARVWALFIISFLMPVVFTPWGRVLFAFGPLRVTGQGVGDGLLFTARLFLLFFATTLLAATTRPHDLAVGLGRLLAPLRIFGVRTDRLAEALSLSWAYFPEFWKKARELVGRGRGRRGWFDRAIHLPGDVVADLYLLAEGTGLDAAVRTGT